MTNQTLMLGDIDIGQYVEKTDISDQRLEEIKAKRKEIESLKKNCLASEKDIYNKLYGELYSEMVSYEYPRIDLGFLEKSQVLKKTIKKEGFFRDEFKEISIQIPAFSVYPFFGTNIFSIRTELGGDVDINKGKKILPITIEKRILKSLGVSHLENVKLREKTDYRKQTSTSYCNSKGRYYRTNFPFNENLELTSEFNGLIPKEVKEKVKKSLEYFNEDDIYFITETKPEEWNVQQIKKDPLVIGLIADEKAYLIDHFDTTPLENLVKNTFLGEKSN